MSTHPTDGNRPEAMPPTDRKIQTQVFQALVEKLRARRKDLLTRLPPRAELVNPCSNARYDAVYEEGLAWLDKL